MNTQIGARIAGIKRQLANGYLHDLIEWTCGDAARFARMVDGRGKSTGSPEQWLANLHSICSNEHILTFYPDLPGQVGATLATLHLDDL